MIEPKQMKCLSRPRPEVLLQYSTLRVYSCPAEGPWGMDHLIQLHDRLISGVDWCPHSNRIVTCSHDCNAFVLAFKDGQWQPDMVSTVAEAHAAR
jgi:hypothetical protein